MRVVIQRVKSASVTVNNVMISSIQSGLLLLVGVTQSDTSTDVEYMASKVSKMRLFPASGKEWAASVKDCNKSILSISQFTLYAKTDKGSKPDFHNAMKGSEAVVLFNEFVDKLRELNNDVQIGEFGAMMDVALVNDGPVTITLDSHNKKN